MRFLEIAVLPKQFTMSISRIFAFSSILLLGGTTIYKTFRYIIWIEWSVNSTFKLKFVGRFVYGAENGIRMQI